MNEIIELQDSTLDSLVYQNGAAAIYLRPAYIHRSPGHLGEGPGTGWIQNATLIVAEVEPFTIPAHLPSSISDGYCDIGDVHYDDTLPTSGTFENAIELFIVLDSGETIIIRGRFLNVELNGEPTFVENFP